MKNTEQVASELSCMTQNDCKSFKTCLKKRNEEDFVKSSIERIDKSFLTGDYGSIIMDCSAFSSKKVIGEKCRKILPEVYTSLIRRARLMRDKRKRNYVICSYLNNIKWNFITDTTKDEGKTVCREMELAESVALGIEDAKRMAKSKRTSLSYQCDDYNLIKFDKLGTPWALLQKKKLIDACFRIHGKAILKHLIVDQKITCSYKLTKIYRKLKKYNIHDKEIDNLIEQIQLSCPGNN
ncbi:MAG: hypothetical protein JXR95_03265 [Deltaproteobacteria bacterium]|nr:hypothetical protein [Deltaproteobacteria bacterium]